MQNNFFNFETKTIMEAHQTNAQVLAFLGDAVHTLFVRMHLGINAKTKSGGLNVLQKKYLSASGQSKAILALLDELNQDELKVFKRARNYKTQSVAKNASVVEYKNATGFEGVLGFLYITGQFERLNQILIKSMQIIEEKN